ncbi:hypothetical protein D9M71_564680 [compost metagenome]
MRNRALSIGLFIDLPVIHHQLGVDSHVVEQNGAAGGGALAKTGPVIDDAQPRRTATNEGQHLLAVVIERLDRDPVGEQRAGGIELLAIEDITIAIGGDTRLEFQGVFNAALRPGIADSPAFQDALEQLFFLRLGGAAEHQVENAELVLRNLPQGRVRRGNDREHLGQGDE